MSKIARKGTALFLCSFALIASELAVAKLPAPDVVYYGVASVGGTRLSAQDTGVEVRLKIGSSVVSTYTMGARTGAGDRYILSVPMDDVDPRQALHARPNDAATIHIFSGGNETLAAAVQIPDYGTIEQLNIGTLDTDGDGIPDALDRDRDGDGIDDTVEKALGLNPDVKDGDDTDGTWKDTDGDDIPDRVELELTRTDPLVDDTDPAYCTPQPGGLTGQWDARFTDRRTPAELADASYDNLYPDTAPADVAFRTETLTGLSICDEVGGFKVWEPTLGYADSASLVGATFTAAWTGGDPASITGTFSTANTLYPATAGRIVGTSAGFAHTNVRLDRRSELDGNGPNEAVLGLQARIVPGPGEATPPDNTLNGHLQLVPSPGGASLTTVALFDARGREHRAWFVPSVGGLFSLNQFDTAVDTNSSGTPDSTDSHTFWLATLALDLPADASPRWRGMSQLVDAFDQDNDGAGPGDAERITDVDVYTAASAPRIDFATLNLGAQQQTRVELNNVPTSAESIQLDPPLSQDLGEGTGLPLTVVDRLLEGKRWSEVLGVGNRLPGFEDGEQVGVDDDGRSLRVAALTFHSAPGSVLDAGNYGFNSFGNAGPMEVNLSHTYSPVTQPAQLLPVVATASITLDAGAVLPGPGNVQPLDPSSAHLVAWDRITAGGVFGNGAEGYELRLRKQSGAPFSQFATTVLKLPLDDLDDCAASASGKCEATIPVLSDEDAPYTLLAKIEATDADDPTNRSQTGELYFDVAPSIDTDADGVGDNVDNCITTPNTNQRDTDADGYGNLCDADLDNSGGLINVGDLGLFRLEFGTNDPHADFDGNGFVDVGDLGRFRLMFGKPPGPSALAP